MFHLVLHTALLILAAFILGTVVGCLLRRFLASGGAYGGARPVEDASPEAKTVAHSKTPTPRKKRPTPAESAAAAATAMVEAQTAARDEETARKDAAARAEHEAQVAQALEESRRKAAAKAEAVVETSNADRPDIMDEDAVTAALASLPADASNEDKANAVGTRPHGLDAPIGGAKDNLQRIKGIGKVNEGKLNNLGIYHFSQIADWTAPEARWVGTFLAFMGRIEREDWIHQAKTLTAGGETAFAKRVDQGEVATSTKSTATPKKQS